MARFAPERVVPLSDCSVSNIPVKEKLRVKKNRILGAEAVRSRPSEIGLSLGPAIPIAVVHLVSGHPMISFSVLFSRSVLKES